MSFLSSDQPPYFFDIDYEKTDEIRFKERMRKLAKLQNEFAFEISEDKEKSYELLNWIAARTLFCERCNVQFYSNIGLVNHKCKEVV